MSAIILEGEALELFRRISAWRAEHPDGDFYDCAYELGFKRDVDNQRWFEHPELFAAAGDPAPGSDAAKQAGQAAAPGQGAGSQAGGVPAEPSIVPRPGFAQRRGSYEAGMIEAAFANKDGAADPAPVARPDLRRVEEAPAAQAAGREEAPADVPMEPSSPGPDPALNQASEAAPGEEAREDENEARRRRNAEALESLDLGSLQDAAGEESAPDQEAVSDPDGADAVPDPAPEPRPKSRLKSFLSKFKGRRGKAKSKDKAAKKKEDDAGSEPIRLLAPDMKRAKIKCRNPYVDASNAYRSRMAALSVQIPWLKAGIVILGLLALGIYAENIVVTNRSHIVPYVMAVDSHGFAIASGTAKPLAYDGKGDRVLTGTTSPNKTALGMGDIIDERVIRAALTDFIAKMRDVTPDVQILRDNIKTCYSMVGDHDPSAQALDEWFSGEDPDTGGMNPLVRAEKHIVHVRFVSAVTLTGSTMSVEWIETTRDRDGARAMPDKRMKANLTWYAGLLKNDIEQIQRNPFGIYVREFHVTSLSVVDSGSADSGEGSDGGQAGS